MSSQENQMRLFVQIVLLCAWAFAFANAQPKLMQADSSLFRSVYSFGDSFVDPGNNNFIRTKARSNFPPYGIDFPGKLATGRFSNARLFPDFLAYYLGSKNFQLPYLGKSFDFNESVTAISFASAASGYDPATATETKALPISQQLQHFIEYKAKLRQIVGKTRATNQIRAAVFYINAGTTDLALNYFHVAFREFPNHVDPPSSLPEYEEFLLKQMQQFIQELRVHGARKFAVHGLPPLGCIPVYITKLPLDPTYPDVQNRERKCLQYMTDTSQEFNSMLQGKLEELESTLPETKIAYIDHEESLLDAIQNPKTYGFDEVNRGCCGTGKTEIGITCNAKTPICGDASKYVFWDALHPTERTNEIIFTSNLQAIHDLIGH